MTVEWEPQPGVEATTSAATLYVDLAAFSMAWLVMEGGPGGASGYLNTS